jgi:hypothetical protein
MKHFRRTLASVVLVLSAVAGAAGQPAQAPLPARASPRKPLIPQSHFHAGHSLTGVRAGGRSPGADAARAAGTVARGAVLRQPASVGMRGVVGLHSAAALGGAASARGSLRGTGTGAAAIDGRTLTGRRR